MTTPAPKISERKIRAPPEFDGDRTKATAFLNNCQTYLRLNKTLYTSDEDCIIFILSYMVGGTAESFKDSVTQLALEEDEDTHEENGFGTMKDFIKAFKIAFEPLDPIDNAITAMKSLKQTGTADDYVALFRPLAARSGIKETAVLSDYFLSGLNNGLVRTIMSVEKLPGSITGYYELATRLDLQWRKGQELTRASNPKKTSSMTGTTTTSSKPQSGTKLRKLTEEEKVTFRSEGRCFRCRELGHTQYQCKKEWKPEGCRQIKVATSTPHNPEQADPTSAISKIRALYAQFTPAEKEEVVNIAEAEGF